MENRRSRTDLNCCRSFRIHCNLNSKDSPPSCSFSRLRELVPIHTGQRCKMKQEIPGISKFPDKRRVPFDQNFRKYRFKIEWNWNCPEIHFENFTSRGCPFFLEIRKFRKFHVPFGISSRYESAPVPLVVKSYKMGASLSSRPYSVS